MIIKISLRIIAVFIAAILVSLVPDLFPKLFGDWYCVGMYEQLKGCLYEGNYSGYHNPTWHWGWRHYLWFLMGLSLMALQVFNVIKLLRK